MKTFLLMMLFSINAMAAVCMVDGITDSPQKFTCSIKDGVTVEKLNLICRNGIYQISWAGKDHNVTVAYHEEVETGSTPLVFVSDRITLTTTSFQSYSSATVSVDGKNLQGRCVNN